MIIIIYHNILTINFTLYISVAIVLRKHNNHNTKIKEIDTTKSKITSIIIISTYILMIIRQINMSNNNYYE